MQYTHSQWEHTGGMAMHRRLASAPCAKSSASPVPPPPSSTGATRALRSRLTFIFQSQLPFSCIAPEQHTGRSSQEDLELYKTAHAAAPGRSKPAILQYRRNWLLQSGRIMQHPSNQAAAMQCMGVTPIRHCPRKSWNARHGLHEGQQAAHFKQSDTAVNARASAACASASRVPAAECAHSRGSISMPYPSHRGNSASQAPSLSRSSPVAARKLLSVRSVRPRQLCRPACTARTALTQGRSSWCNPRHPDYTTAARLPRRM